MKHDSNKITRVAPIGSAWRDAVDAVVEALGPRIQRVREYLHAHPELSGQEFETTRYIRAQLDEDRFTMRTGPDGRGLIVDEAVRGRGPLVALRADIDALPIQDAKRATYASKTPDVMHACGHDAHTAAVLGAVWALDEMQSKGLLPRPLAYRAIFQPAEETNKGAVEMCAAGAMEGVGAVLGAHMDPFMPAGLVGVRDGVFTADCVELGVRIIGRGGHAARPHQSFDPISVAAQLITSLYAFVPRGADSHDPVVLSFGAIHGGDAPNSIPDSVTMRGTLRTMNPHARERAKEHILRLSEALANASTTKIEIRFTDGPPALVNDSNLTALIAGEARNAVGVANVREIVLPSMGGEDFANYLSFVPGAMFRVGCGVGTAPEPLHSPRFDVAPEALVVAAKVLARAAIAWTEESTREGGSA